MAVIVSAHAFWPCDAQLVSPHARVNPEPVAQTLLALGRNRSSQAISAIVHTQSHLWIGTSPLAGLCRARQTPRRTVTVNPSVGAQLGASPKSSTTAARTRHSSIAEQRLCSTRPSSQVQLRSGGGLATGESATPLRWAFSAAWALAHRKSMRRQLRLPHRCVRSASIIRICSDNRQHCRAMQ